MRVLVVQMMMMTMMVDDIGVGRQNRLGIIIVKIVLKGDVRKYPLSPVSKIARFPVTYTNYTN